MARLGVRRSIRRPKRYIGKRKRPTRPIRRVRRRRGMTSRSLILSGFPNKKLVKLRYVSQRLMDCGLDVNGVPNGIGTCLIRANDLYDPENSVMGSTTGGHQPMGFDQWSAIYNHFTVVGSKITVKFVNTGITHVVPGLAGIMLTDAPRIGPSLFITTLEQLMENRLRTQPTTAGLVLGNGNSETTKTMRFSARKFFGKSVIGEDIYRGSASAGPSEEAYFEVYYAPMGGAPAIGAQVMNNPGIITAIIQVDYIALFTEPKPLGQS